MISFGTVPAGSTLYIPFSTYAGSTGASATCTGLAVTDIEIYKNGSTTQRASDAGYALLDTDGIDFDGITGLHGFSLDLSDNTDANFYAVGSWYWVVVSAITVDSQTVTFLAAVFRIGPAEVLTGYPVVDAGAISGDTDAANNCELMFDGTGYAGGTTKLNVNTSTITNDAITAAAIAADAGTEIGAEVKTAVEAAGSHLALILDDTGTSGVVVASGSKTGYTLTATTGLGNQTANITGNLSGSVGSVATGGITTASFAAGAIDAAAIANGAIDAATFAADVDAEIAAMVWNAATASYGTSGSYGEALEAVGSSADPWLTNLPGAYSAGTAGYIIGTNVNATISSRGTGTALDAAGVRTAVGLATANLDTQLAAIVEDTGTTLDTKINTISTAVVTTIPGTITTLTTNVGTIDTLLDKFSPFIIGTVSGAGTGTEVYSYGGIAVTVTVDSSGNVSSVVFS